ncbi:hypothetical protein PSPO01_12489 [Paraphaeosphaeria sporulosa]
MSRKTTKMNVLLVLTTPQPGPPSSSTIATTVYSATISTTSYLDTYSAAPAVFTETVIQVALASITPTTTGTTTDADQDAISAALVRVYQAPAAVSEASPEAEPCWGGDLWSRLLEVARVRASMFKSFPDTVYCALLRVGRIITDNPLQKQQQEEQQAQDATADLGRSDAMEKEQQAEQYPCSTLATPNGYLVELPKELLHYKEVLAKEHFYNEQMDTYEGTTRGRCDTESQARILCGLGGQAKPWRGSCNVKYAQFEIKWSHTDFPIHRSTTKLLIDIFSRL